MCEKISKGEIREIIVCGVQSGQAVISVSCSRHCGDGLSKFQHSHHEFSQISFNKRGGQCHLSHFWETKESLNMSQTKNISKVVWFVVRANIAVQLEIKCIFRYLRSSAPLWIIYLCAMGMSQNMLDLLQPQSLDLPQYQNNYQIAKKRKDTTFRFLFLHFIELNRD